MCVQVAKVVQEESSLNKQQDIVPPNMPALVRPNTKAVSPGSVRQNRIQVNREVAQQLPPPQGLYELVGSLLSSCMHPASRC